LIFAFDVRGICSLTKDGYKWGDGMGDLFGFNRAYFDQNNKKRKINDSLFMGLSNGKVWGVDLDLFCIFNSSIRKISKGVGVWIDVSGELHAKLWICYGGILSD
jgi:hypothetical protein